METFGNFLTFTNLGLLTKGQESCNHMFCLSVQI